MINGTQIALEFPETSPPPLILPPEAQIVGEEPLETPPLAHSTRGHLKTLADLLHTIQGSEPRHTSQQAMLNSTAAHLCRYLNRAPHKIDIDTLTDTDELDGFETYLRERGGGQRRLKRGSVRSYLYFVRLFLRKARNLGWSERQCDAAEEWREVLALAKRHDCSGVVQYAIRNRLKPANFCDAHLEEMGQTMTKKGYTPKYVKLLKRQFRKLLAESGFQKNVPGVSSYSPKPRYGIRLSEFPQPMRREVLELLTWKTARLADGRPAKSRIRHTSAETLQEFFCELYGFARNIKHEDPSTIVDLLSKDVLGKFLDWRIAERGVKIRSLLASCSMVSHIVKTYPPLADKGLEWIPQLVTQLWDEAEDPDDKAKARKWVSYDELARIPEEIRREIGTLGSSDAKKKAILFRDLLLIAWPLVQPWRQKNLRECKLGDPANGANLYKREIFPLSTLARPKWVEEALKKNPKEEFWQIHFRREETKAGHPVQAILPKQLVCLLEEWLQVHRPVLLRNGDPGTLFLNDRGRPYCKYTIRDHIKNITFRHTGKEVNPHLFRDIVAMKWLDEHPEDYLTVSKLLWHSDIRTTLRIYGRRFDESHANRRMEQWREERH